MKKLLFVPATVVALAVAFSRHASAAEKKEGAESKAASVEEQMDNLVKQGPGVHNIKKDKQGAGAEPRCCWSVEDQHRPRRSQGEGSGPEEG